MRWSLLRAVSSASAFLVVAACGDDPVQPVATPPGALPQPRQAVAPAAQGGSWSAPLAWPIVAAHSTVLPDGRVLSWTSNDNDHAFHTPNVYLWHPSSPGAFSQVPNAHTDVFCAGHSFLPDGKLLIAGGHFETLGGVKDANIFNFASGTWSRVIDMAGARWYPTTLPLGNGHVVVVAGSDEHHHANLYPEVWDGAKFRLLGGAPLEMPYYPWLHLGPDGRAFNAGPEQVTRYLNPAGDGEWTYYGNTTSGVHRDYGTSVMYEPGKVLIIGGGDPPVKSAEVVDLNAGTGWQPTGPMQFARRQANALSLPDGRVLVVGGTSSPGFYDESGAVLTPEVWDPATGTWSVLNDMKIPRGYHSTAVLLPDARVLAAGGGRCGTCYVEHADAELFSPPYLFNADGSAAVRPTITSAPTTVNRGQTFTVATPDAASIKRVTLVRLPSTTHAFNMNQGFTSLAFTATPTGLTVTAPANPNLVPAGHYMLFVLNGSGVPSVAKIVQLNGTAALPTAPAAPAAPTSLTASAVPGPKTNLKWADNSTSESAFGIERCAGAGCTGFATIATVAPNTTAYVDTALTAGTTYSYRVRATNSTGPSAYSNTVVTTASTTTATTLVNRLSARCMEVPGVSQQNLTQVKIWDCHGGENQQWTTPAVGTTGEIRVYGTKCLDGYGAESGGKDGDLIIIYDCHGGSNQQWTRTPAGEIRTLSGTKCIELKGKATANWTDLVLWSCDGSASQKWDVPGGVNQPPVAKFTYACTGLTCAFDGSPSTDDQGVVAYSWAFGVDGIPPSTAAAPTIAFPAAGTYPVTLTVKDAAGQTGTSQQSVTVTAPANQLPAASFTAACTGLACTFTDGSTDADGRVVGWSWSFGDGTTSTAQSPSRSYAGAGTYTVTLTVTDDRGGTGTASKSVTVAAANQPPVAGFTNSCTGLGCTFSDASTDADGTVASYAWAFGDGASSSLANPSHSYAAAGSYTVVLTVTDDKGATNSASKSVTVTAPVNQPPAAGFTFACSNLACTFTNTSTDPDGTVASSQWDLGGGATSTASNPTHTYPAAGTYPVTLTVTDDKGAPSSVTKNVTVTAPPAPPPISLITSAYKSKGFQQVGLSWSGATTTAVDVYRDGTVIATPANDPSTKSGSYTDNLNRKGGGTYKYKVCEAGSTTVCSNEGTAIF